LPQQRCRGGVDRFVAQAVGIQPGLVHQAGVLPGRECCDGVRVHGVLPLAAVDRRLAANVGSRPFPRHRAGFKTALHRPQGGPPYHRRMQGLGFDDLRLFARVAALGSLSAAARERDVPVSQVSRALTRIERSCGVRLVHRSTHGLALSAEGETFLGYCQRVTAALDELEGDFASQAREPSGLVRVAASSVVAQYLLLPSLAGLAERHPKLRIDLEVGDRLIDLAREGIDLAIRTATTLPDTMVARELGRLGRALYASPAYAERVGLPQRPADLAQHRLITNTAAPQLNHWPFIIEGRAHTIVAEGTWRSNDTGMAANLVLQGLGIGRLGTLAAGPLVRAGLLVPVLAGFVDEQTVPIYAVTATARQRLPKIRACIEYWAEWIRSTDAAPRPTAGRSPRA
jgi:DNA-binding transcriptional LysR family regulator